MMITFDGELDSACSEKRSILRFFILLAFVFVNLEITNTVAEWMLIHSSGIFRTLYLYEE
jgi:hypothetical protein